MYYNSYELYHHGILGQKWGIRRFQNKDGSLKPAGEKRYYDNDSNGGSKVKAYIKETGKKAVKYIGETVKVAGKEMTKAAVSAGLRSVIGSSTSTGSKNVNRGDDSQVNSSNKERAKKIAAGLGIAAAVGVSAAVLANPNARRYISNFAGKSAESLKTMAARNAPKVKAYMKEAGKKAVKSLGESAKAAGKEMTKAAIASIGAIAIAKVVSKIDTGNADLDEVLRNTSTAGLRSVIGSSSGSGAKSTNRGGPIDRAKGAEISQVVGPPKQKEIDRTGPEYQGLFKDAAGNNRDPETRSMIKSMASAGYGVDQINQYLGMLDRGEIKHGDIDAFRPTLSAYIGLAYTAGLLSV